jgi:uncharacterized protein DUF6766
MRFVRDNSLALFFLVIFLATLVGQALVGHADFNHQQLAHQGDPISLGRYVTSSSFGVDVMENWQSEYLQFTLYILTTVWFVQRGSPESKPLDQIGRESDEQQKLGAHADERSPRWARVGGLRTVLFSNSLVLVMTTIWLLSWLAQSITGRIDYNANQFDHQLAALTWPQYLLTPDFWDRTLQNWQSEFLAVGSMAVLSIYLRQRGSPESKPVGAAHADTGSSG